MLFTLSLIKSHDTTHDPVALHSNCEWVVVGVDVFSCIVTADEPCDMSTVAPVFCSGCVVAGKVKVLLSLKNIYTYSKLKLF